MILLHHVVEVFHLPDDDRGTVFLIVALDRGCIGVAAVHGHRLGEPVAADRLRQKPQRGHVVSMLGAQKVHGLAVCVHRPIQRAPLAFDLHRGVIYPPTDPYRALPPVERLSSCGLYVMTHR